MAGYVTPSWNNNTSPAIDASALTAVGEAIELSQHPFGVCSTAAATAAKTVTIDFSGTLTLYDGLRVIVRFTNENRAPYPTLNVNGTGAVQIWQNGYQALGTPAGSWPAGAVVEFVYSNTRWNVVGTAAVPCKAIATLVASSWRGSGPYTNTLGSIQRPSGTSINLKTAGYLDGWTKADIEPDADTIAQLAADGVTGLYIENDGSGYLTAYAVGAAPTQRLTLTVTLSQVVPES